jgi:hypothetical protein
MSATGSHQRHVDPLERRTSPERPHYATGVLLDSDDFISEQTYHRGRLAQAVGFITGGGTLAGLGIAHVAPAAQRAEEIRVAAGLAVDRLGRLIELPRAACLRVQRWWEQIAADEAGRDDLGRAAYDNLGRFISDRASAGAGQSGAPALPSRAVVADLFIRFVACEQGYTPSFANGPFDALDSVSPSRVRDAYELMLVLRPGLDDDFSGLPGTPNLPADPTARRNAVHDAILAAWPDRGEPDRPNPLPPLPEHPNGVDTSAQFLGRVLIPVNAANPPQRNGHAVVVDNWSRRFLPSTQMLQHWLAT